MMKGACDRDSQKTSLVKEPLLLICSLAKG